MLKEGNMHPTDKWHYIIMNWQKHIKLLSMGQLGTFENTSKIWINNNYKGNKKKSLNKIKAKQSSNLLIYIIA